MDTWVVTDSAGTSYNIYRQFTFNIELQDKDGTALNGKTVVMKDTNGNTVFTATTDANGNISFSGQHSSPVDNTVSYKRYYDNSGTQEEVFAPFTLYIDDVQVATFEADDVESFEVNRGAKLILTPNSDGGGGGGCYMRRR